MNYFNTACLRKYTKSTACSNIFKLSLLITLTSFAYSAVADHASASFETGAAGAINTLTGSTLPEGKFVFGIGAQFIENDDISNERLEQLGAVNNEAHSTDRLLNLTANVAYGITDNLSVGLSLPYVDRQNISEAENDGPGIGEAEFAGDSRGLGDLNLFGQYRFYSSDSTDVAIIAGLKTPTGNTSERELEGSLFEAEQQAGSGSWDPFTRISMNRSWGRTGVSANLLYTLVTEGTQNTDLGDILNYNVAASYRAYLLEEKEGHNHDDHQHSIFDYVDVILELNGDYRKRVEINNVEDINTGGNTIYLSPGIRVGLGQSWSVFSSLGIPIINDLDGAQSEPEYRVAAGISRTF